jgi:hypothetical protein
VTSVVFLLKTTTKPFLFKQFKVLLSRVFGTNKDLQGLALPITRDAVILRAEPGTSGFLVQLIKTRLG